MNAVRDWLISHIQKMDQKYAGCVNSGGSSVRMAGRAWGDTTGTPSV